MDTKIINSKNGKRSDRNRQLRNISEKINFKRSDKYVVYQIWKSDKNIEFKISALTWNEEFELLDGSHSVSYIQEQFAYILKKIEKN